jgi:hypothetical protein
MNKEKEKNMKNFNMELYRWYDLGKNIDTLYKDDVGNIVLLLRGDKYYSLLFIVKDDRLENRIPIISFLFGNEAIEFFEEWKEKELPNILKRQFLNNLKE